MMLEFADDYGGTHLLLAPSREHGRGKVPHVEAKLQFHRSMSTARLKSFLTFILGGKATAGSSFNNLRIFFATFFRA